MRKKKVFISLPEFIRQEGAVYLSKKLDLDVSTIHKWKNEISLPEPHNVFLLMKLSHGRLTFDSIYGSYFKTNHSTQLSLGI